MKLNSVGFAVGMLLPVALCLTDVIDVPTMLVTQLFALVAETAYRIVPSKKRET